MEDLDAQDLQLLEDELAKDSTDEDFWRELVLYTSIILRSRKDVSFSSFFGRETSVEYKNGVAWPIIAWIGASRDFRRQSEYRERVWISDRLPDVCGSCFHSYGLCVSGRYRISCPKCKGAEDGQRLAFDIRYEPHRLCMYGGIVEACLVQLIYKYYSPNGDRSYVIKEYNLWTF